MLFPRKLYCILVAAPYKQSVAGQQVKSKSAQVQIQEHKNSVKTFNFLNLAGTKNGKEKKKQWIAERAVKRWKREHKYKDLKEMMKKPTSTTDGNDKNARSRN